MRMKSTVRPSVAIATVVALCAAALTLGAAPAMAAVPNLAQHVAVPAYIPTSDTASWGSLTPAAAQLGFIVVNVANGPDTAVNADWKAKIDLAHSHGIKVLGYVDSGYFGASAPVRRTVLGDTDANSWTVQAQLDINRWYDFYGTSIDGIFIDDGMNTCGPGTTNTYADLYSDLNDYIHSNHVGALTVVNPGISVPQCYEDTADIIVTYEGNSTNYLNPSADLAPKQWQLDGDPNKFWEIIYDVTAANLTTVMNRSKTNNAGYVYATPDNGGNPYDTAPTGTYWTNELAATTATGTTVPPTPATPTAADVYSTGVDLSWASSSSTSVVGYDVYRTVGSTSVKIGSVGNYYPAASEFTVPGLAPSTSYSFTVKARTLNGIVSAASAVRTISTDSAWGAVPTTPTLTSSNLTANGVQLNWTTSTSTTDTVAVYDVYINGVRRLTLPGTVHAAHVGFLTPGTAYTFTVTARVTSDTASAASNTVSVTTPSPTPIASPSVTFGATTAHFQAQYNLTYNFQHVFIDTDANAATGYAFGGIGADFLIEGGTLLSHVVGTTGWDWTPVTLASGPLVSSTSGLYVWEVPSSTLGSTTSLRVIFNGSGSSTEFSTAVLTAAKQ